MKRKPMIGVALAVAMGAGTSLPSTAAAVDNSRDRYSLHYASLKDEGGKPGRNIVQDGVNEGGKVRPATLAEVNDSYETLVTMRRSIAATKRAPKPVRTAPANIPASQQAAPAQQAEQPRRQAAAQPSTQASAPAAKAQASSGGGGGGNLPSCTWAPESGGDYGAVNGSSGAAGKYQIMPQTWQAYGGSGGSAASASPAEQDRVASKIYAAEGGSPWVNC